LAVLPQLTEGYRHAAELLMRARASLTATGSIWRVVLEQEHAPRVVIRDTLTYAMLMSRSLAPAYLRSAPKRRRALLSTLSADTPPSIPPALLRAEASALFAVHMPRFVVLPGSRTLAASSGRAIAHRFASHTPAHGVLKDIEALSPKRLNDLLLPALLTSCF
jgi:lantibiotic modifying enzyme